MGEKKKKKEAFLFRAAEDSVQLTPFLLLEEKIKAIIFEGFVMPSLVEKVLV